MPDAIAGLPTHEERFDALRSFCEQTVAAGFLRTVVDPPAHRSGLLVGHPGTTRDDEALSILS